MQKIILKNIQSILSPAKINFRLFILEKKQFYHELLLDIIPITIFDQLIFLPGEKTRYLPQDEIVAKTIALFEKKFNIIFELDFKLIKNIPYQAGLGGSSGNAAAAIYFLCSLAEIKIDKSIMDFASLIGADVPFFLNGQPAIASGKGDKLKKLADYQDFFLVIAKPEFNIKTEIAYKKCQPKKDYKWLDLKDIKNFPPEVNGFWAKDHPYFNRLSDIRKNLLENSDAQNVLLTGSGSSLTMIFNNEKNRDDFFYNQSPRIKNINFFLANTLSSFNFKIEY